MKQRYKLRRVSRRMPWIEFAVALCVLVAVAVASDTVTSRLASAQYWVGHTHDVETAIALARGDIVAAGDARQIYMITGDQGSLADYERARDAIPGELASLQSLTSDNQMQQANVQVLRRVVDQRLALLQQSIDLRKEATADAEQQKQWTRDDVALQNQVLATFDRMKAEEDRLMAVRQTISSRTYQRVRILLLVSFAVVVALLAINFYDLSRELKEHKQAQAAVQQLSGRLLRVQDEERRRVARELHDSIGQIFAVLKVNLEMISKSFMDGNPRQIPELLAESKAALEIGLSDARTLSHLLHPPLLDEMGFASAARWLADGFARRSNIQVKLEIPEDIPRMAQDLELTLFRILQEALTNIHKHSGSPAVDITLQVNGSTVALLIRDYGKGIPAHVIESFKKRHAGLGVGLAGMCERVRDLGGCLELRSDGNGAEVYASAPFVRAMPEQNPDQIADESLPEQQVRRTS